MADLLQRPPGGVDLDPNKLSGQNLTPSAGSSPDNAGDPNDPDAVMNQKLAAIRAQLNESLSKIPNVDFEGKYKELLQQTQNRPTVPAGPQGLAAAAYALGAPNKAPQIMEERAGRHQQDVLDKEHEMLQLKEALIHGDIQQSIAKADFRRALTQHDAMVDTQRAIAENERQHELQSFQSKADITTKEHLKEIEARGDEAMKRAELVAKTKTSIAEKQRPEYAHIYSQTFMAMMRPNPLTGFADFTEAQAAQIAERTADESFATQSSLVPPKTAAPTKSTGKAAAAKPASPAPTGGYAAWKAAQGQQQGAQPK